MTNTFEKNYWLENYSQPQTMDGIGNATEHIKYLKYLLKLEHIDISSIVDLGCGLGKLFQKALKEFVPYKATGIEPSDFAFKALQKMKLKPVESTNLKLYPISLQQWCQLTQKREQHFDLGICTSVFQYLDKSEIISVLPVMAQRIKYLYFSVPTDLELKRQKEEIHFHDRFAIPRSADWYQKILRKHFTFISSRFLESKNYFSAENTLFTDLLFRY